MVSELPMKPPVARRTEKREKFSKKTSPSSDTAVRLQDRVRKTLDVLKIRVQGERREYVKSKLKKNCNTLHQQLEEVERLSREREIRLPPSTAESLDDDEKLSRENGSLILQSQMVLFRENSHQSPNTDKINSPQICARLNPGNSDARKVVFVVKAKLEAVNRLPSYTAWMFVDRNELMTKDQSIDRRRRISYESNGRGWQGETFFCLDDQEETVDVVEKTKVFRSLSAVEELISRMAVLEHGASRAVLETVADFLQVSVAKVESIFQSFPTAEYGNKNRNLGEQRGAFNSVSQVFPSPVRNNLPVDDEGDVRKGIPDRAEANVEPINERGSQEETEVSTTLAVELETFDSLFCRRCLLFNCSLHCLEEEIVVEANEIQPPCKMTGQDQLKPCSPWCHFLVSSNFARPPAASNAKLLCTSGSDFQRSSQMSCATELNQGYFPAGGAIREDDDHVNEPLRAFAEDIRQLDDADESEEVLLDYDENRAVDEAVEGLLNSHEKKKWPPTISDNCVRSKNAHKAPNNSSTLGEAAVPIRRADEDAESSCDSKSYRYDRKRRNVSSLDGDPLTSFRSTNGGSTWDEKRIDTSEQWCSFNSVDEVQLDSLEEEPLANPAKGWNRLEQDLCEKGIQIFGKDSCMIAQNILKGLKSCQEIYEYIDNQDSGEAAGSGDESSSGRALSKRGNKLRRVEILPTGRVIRSKFRFGRKKVAPKFALGSIRKRIGKDGGVLSLCRQYTPCNCESRLGCGKECPCVKRNMHCEKYCGCFKVCQNRFRGCQCAKSMCDRRNCPCFASGRECDPDVCKFCWIDCGHSSSQDCHNMRILLRKKKRLLLAQSDVCTGWGVFTRHLLDKNEYIGEYTGELISRSEADRRGRIYDRETSFLFNLNDKLVVDAFRKGNKLKFANHSAHKPNCYAKVVLVGGNHRVGIYAKEQIEAGEELLYDYQYEPEIAPLWATGPG